MAYILNIETATKNCSVALAHDGKAILHREIADKDYSHAEKLHIFIDEIISEAGISYQDLSAVAVSQGPGSYTGLRIGVSAAKGLCYALNIPLIAVDTLQSLAFGLKGFSLPENALIVPMIDARRMEVYSAVYSAMFDKIRQIQAEIITPESFQEFDAPVYIIGDCAEKCKPVLTSDKFIFIENVVYPSALDMCVLSYESHKKSDTVDVAYFEPYYLKDFFFPSKSS
ncbi:tRNA (adenosine(37)-N6)-threonylcarbamoyltransferase complex dimerization subunit type 1 TsaB [Flavobacterium pallidum]|uniref:tRNA (Adenosine(37)-N6)-threonylcarbamoyltransferase complex dimerization subunit type 1 TsaB n=1 Tax=Flavobacterium pallidum TaxID=2172098 RepID=A0A2S1SGD3_9FLAO|nr:tRNA (adenosine(37)-N6)-threonylcarbamoyltransferase complex dimerization subunit type 1 TsaB [Flavobacterium pallidum]AWI25412.1 tRNA (adenosine(37)-N6)-threonylcarbamoyltransferase complex dimerization subunit type 1 TsaB [Flavobacterium pallidum]